MQQLIVDEAMVHRLLQRCQIFGREVDWHGQRNLLIESNTSHSVGSTTIAAEAMRKRLIDAGFPVSDVVVLGPDERHGNLIARYRGHRAAPRSPC